MTNVLVRSVKTAVGTLRRCPVCATHSAARTGVCPSCEQRLTDAVAASPAPTGPVFWLGSYAGPWLRLVHALKYEGDRRLAGPLGTLIARRLVTASFRPDIVTHVPASPSRRKERGFDQAQLLAEAVAKVLGSDARELLFRSVASRSQGRLSRAERALNAGTSFLARPCTGRNVLLVDDVYTTGATTASCTMALTAAGAKETWTAVVARTARR